MAKKKDSKQADNLIKIDADNLIQFTNSASSKRIVKEVKFFDGDDEYSVEVAVKSLSYDEVVNLMRGKDAQKTLMSDLVKARIVASIFNKDTNKPLFTDKNIGIAAPHLVDALHKVSDEVNDFSGKYLMEKLTKKNSGTSLSSTESEEEQLQKQNEV